MYGNDHDYHREEEAGKGCCKCCTSSRLLTSSIFVTLFGLIIIGIAQWLPPYVDSALRQGVIDQITVTENGQKNYDDTWASWQTNGPEKASSSAEWYSVNFWNCTNPTEFLNGTELPNFVEVGPFTYRYVSRKFNFKWGYDSEGRKTLDYQSYKFYLFNKERSCASCDPDALPITTLNFPFHGLMYAMQNGMPANVFKLIFDLAYSKWSETSRMFVTKSANELLWGYHDPTLDAIQGAIDLAKQMIPALQNLTIHVGFDGILGPNMTSQHWAQENTGFDGIYTGEDYPELLMQKYKFQDNTYLTCGGKPGWAKPGANRVHGTDGSQYHSGVKKGSSLPTWVDALYRVATVVNENSLVVKHKDIELYRFVIPDSLMQNETLNPDNTQYYMSGPSGAINISSCAPSNIPIFMTKPHFLGASSAVRTYVNGMNPDASIHDTFVDVEPTTGIVMRVLRRLQVTLNTQPNHILGWFNNVNNQTLFPVLWLSDGGEATEEQANTFKNGVYFARDLSYYTLWVAYIVGNIIVIGGMTMMYCATGRRASEKGISLNSR